MKLSYSQALLILTCSITEAIDSGDAKPTCRDTSMTEWAGYVEFKSQVEIETAEDYVLIEVFWYFDEDLVKEAEDNQELPWGDPDVVEVILN